MKKRHVDHVLRAAGKIAGDDQFIIIGSQSLHGKYPDLPDEFGGLCLDPHDLAIAKYVARRDKDVPFTRALARRGLVKKEVLLQLLGMTPVSDADRRRIAGYIDVDFEPPAAGNKKKVAP